MATVNKSITEMLAKPGIHCVASDGGFLVVEVEADGTCHQLNAKTGDRDGVLRRERWSAYACEVWPHADALPWWFAARKAQFSQR